jgi:hypothetical protein
MLRLAKYARTRPLPWKLASCMCPAALEANVAACPLQPVNNGTMLYGRVSYLSPKLA